MMKAFMFKGQTFTTGTVKVDDYDDIKLFACNVLNEDGEPVVSLMKWSDQEYWSASDPYLESGVIKKHTNKVEAAREYLEEMEA
jgi:hypothetical protein